mmetsp:Transcript_9168/g.16281  ORF Transcript_9168/g.16281 Transcript_9168/m.16281 type:complete len:192 (-) Transcript_9168:47-622(-)
MALPRMFLGFFALALMRAIDFEDDFNLLLLRIAFTAVQALILVTMFFLRQRIKAEANQTKITVPVAPKFGEVPPEKPEEEVITIEDYDLSQLQALLKKTLIGVAVCGFMHWKWGLNPPLFMQAVLNPFQMMGHQLTKIYFFHQEAKGQLARPWKEETPFDAFKPKLPEDQNKLRQEKKRAEREAKKAKKGA